MPRKYNKKNNTVPRIHSTMIYSHSRLSTFEQCPYKYKLKYINKIKTDIQDTIITFLGSRVHETLEKLYRDLDNQKKNTIDELLIFYNNQWKKYWSNDTVIVKTDYDMDQYRKMGETYIREFYEKYHPFDQDRTIALEERILIDLDDSGDYKLQGYIDRLSEQREGYYVIHDYKTNKQLPPQEHFDSDRQLALYAIGVKKNYPNVKDIDLAWHFLKFNKQIKSKRSEKQLQQLKKETLGLIKKIEKTTIFDTNPSYLCDWCEYKPICLQWSHLYNLYRKSENEYLKDSKVTLVDRYAELKKKNNQLNLDQFAEIEKLERALIKYAEKENIEVIFGTNDQVSIKKQPRYSMPSKGSTIRQRLEHIFKEHKKWDEIQQLDINVLNKIMHENQWDEHLISLIKPYVKYSESTRLYLSRKKDQ